MFLCIRTYFGLISCFLPSSLQHMIALQFSFLCAQLIRDACLCVLLAHSMLPTLFSDDHTQICCLVLATYAPVEDL